MTCDRVIILDRGSIKACDTPSNLIHQMRTAGTVNLEILADPQIAADKLRKIEHVRKVVRDREDDHGWVRFTVRTESGYDVRADIAEVTGRNNWPMRELHRQTASLEDVFVELTQTDRTR